MILLTIEGRQDRLQDLADFANFLDAASASIGHGLVQLPVRPSLPCHLPRRLRTIQAVLLQLLTLPRVNLSSDVSRLIVLLLDSALRCHVGLVNLEVLALL